MQVAKIRILDEVSAVVVGLRDDHMKKLYEQYGIFVAGYFFQPLYQLGRWDGKVRYFSEHGKTYVFLLGDIITKIAGWGYKLELEDLRDAPGVVPNFVDDQLFSNILHKDTGRPTILREHQVRAVNALIEHGSGVVLAATSAGKTIMCAALCRAYGEFGLKTLTIVPSQDLIIQTKADYVTYLGSDNVGEYSGSHKNLAPQHIVSTWQALKNNPAIVQQFQMVIVDEAHGLRGKQLSKLLTEHAAHIPFRFGVTGTLPKEQVDKMAVQVALGEVRCTIPASELIDKGVLSQIQINVVQLVENLYSDYNLYKKEFVSVGLGDKPLSYSKFKETYFGDYAAEQRYIRKHTARIDWIAQKITEARNNTKGNTLCLVDNITFGRQLASKIEGAIFVNGQDVKQKDRKPIYDMFKDSDDLVVIATVHVAGTGLSINRIFNLFLIDIGKSFTRVIQSIGRGLRKSGDKDFINVNDICSDLKYGKRHLADRVKFYNEAQYPYTVKKIEYE